jgi:cell division protein FtsI/penicillin-binding protein 2
MKSILIPSKVFVTVTDGVTKDARLQEIINKAMEQKMIVLAFYFKNGDVLAVVAKARHDDRVFEVRLIDAQLNMNDWFNTHSDKLFLDEVDVLKDAEIAGSVTAYWIIAKMKRFKERTSKTTLAFFYNPRDEKLYALTATEYFVNLENITGILWDP